MTDHPSLNVQLLPPQLKMLIQRIGYARTQKLIRARGGLIVWIPKKATEDRVLAQVIGKDALTVLCEYHGGERLELPKEDKLLVQERDALIWRLRHEGWTAPQLAREFELTRRYIMKICARKREALADADRQGQLFASCAGQDD